MANGIEAVGSRREGSDKELKRIYRNWLLPEPQKYCKNLKHENSYNMYKTLVLKTFSCKNLKVD